MLYFLLYYPHYNTAYQKHSETPLCIVLHARWMADVTNSSHFWPTEISCKNIVLITWEWCEPRHFPQEFLMAWSEQFFRNMTEDSSMFLWSAQSNFFVIRDLKFNYRTTMCCNYCGCTCVYLHTWNIIKLGTWNWNFFLLSLVCQTLGCNPNWLKEQ